MDIKNLPIKLFKKRDDVDDRRTEGGGSRELPTWVLSTNEAAILAREFLNVLSDTRSLIESRVAKDNFLPAVLKVSLRDYAVAKTHRSHVGKIFNVSSKFNFIGMSDDCDLLVKIDDTKDVEKISRNLANIQDNVHGLSSIKEISIFRPFVEAEEGNIKVRLINFNNYNVNQIAESKFTEVLLNKKLSFKKTKYAEDLTIYKIQDATLDLLEDLESFEALYSISPMPKLSVGFDSVESEFEIPIKYPLLGIKYPIVGVLDSGIHPVPHLKPWLLEDSFTCYPDDLTDKSHGTFVAGIIVYGDELEGQHWIGNEGSMLYSATVFPSSKETIYEDELIENIRSAINSRPDIKIWNFSGGLKVECDNNDFSDFGKFLDDIQEKKDIIICKSAGNCDNFVRARPIQRIPKSADSVRSLVVGSLAHKKSSSDLVECEWPSPFSRIGFGPNNLIKPDITHYGGNAGARAGRITQSGVFSFGVDGKTAANIGTSFSTPRITALVAGLDHKIAEEFNPLLLKSLIIHSARYPTNVDLTSVDKLKYMGYGLPARVEEILYNAPNEITLILQDTIVKGSFYEILDFPYPSSMIEDGKYYGEISFTLVTSPLLDNNHATEYCQSNIDVSFGTYDRIKERDTNVRTIINEFGAEGAINLLNESKYSKKHLNNPLSDFAQERVLRNYGKKYHPVKKYSVNLSELTPGNATQALSAPKQWFLRLEGLFSSFAETRSKIDGTELSQEFCLVISIKDTRKQSDVYNAVTRQLDSKNFVHQNIQIRNEVNIRLGGEEPSQ